MKHLALALSILSFSNFSYAGSPDSPAHKKSPQDVVQKVKAHKAEAAKKMKSKEASSRSAQIKAETDANLVTRDKVQDKKMTVKEIKQRNTPKVRNSAESAETRAKKAVKSL